MKKNLNWKLELSFCINLWQLKAQAPIPETEISINR